MTAAWFVIAAMAGATLRYAADRALGQGTLAVNVSGSFLLGVLAGLALYHGLGPAPRTVVGTGFCGALTTFSTFSADTVRLAEEGDAAGAARNVALSVILGGLAAAAGIALMAM